eukprot:COSAG05_NODE_1119_length_5816_cov_7.262375_3_plen_87_part_00
MSRRADGAANIHVAMVVKFSSSTSSIPNCRTVEISRSRSLVFAAAWSFTFPILVSAVRIFLKPSVSTMQQIGTGMHTPVQNKPGDR